MTDPTKTYFTTAAIDVLQERLRQMNVKGFTPEHDDDLAEWELAVIARDTILFPDADTKRRDLVKAAALILAEIDRLDRAELRRLA